MRLWEARLRQARPRVGRNAFSAHALQSITAAQAGAVPTKALPGGRSGLAQSCRVREVVYIAHLPEIGKRSA